MHAPGVRMPGAPRHIRCRVQSSSWVSILRKTRNCDNTALARALISRSVCVRIGAGSTCSALYMCRVPLFCASQERVLVRFACVCYF